MVVHAGWTGAVRAVYVENVPLDAGTFDGWCLVGSFWRILFMYHVYQYVCAPSKSPFT